MASKKIEPKREARIVDEIIVDAHTDEERAMSWYYHLEGELRCGLRSPNTGPWPLERNR